MKIMAYITAIRAHHNFFFELEDAVIPIADIRRKQKTIEYMGRHYPSLAFPYCLVTKELKKTAINTALTTRSAHLLWALGGIDHEHDSVEIRNPFKKKVCWRLRDPSKVKELTDKRKAFHEQLDDIENMTQLFKGARTLWVDYCDSYNLRVRTEEEKVAAKLIAKKSKQKRSVEVSWVSWALL